MATVEGLLEFLRNAPLDFSESENIKKFILPNGEAISCVKWQGQHYITGTDIIRCVTFRFQALGRVVRNIKKFEEGVFSDLRNLKPGTDASLEDPHSELLRFLHRHQCIRTQKKQKVFFWTSVPHHRMFAEAVEREIKRDALGLECTTALPEIPPVEIQLSPDTNWSNNIFSSQVTPKEEVWGVPATSGNTWMNIPAQDFSQTFTQDYTNEVKNNFSQDWSQDMNFTSFVPNTCDFVSSPDTNSDINFPFSQSQASFSYPSFSENMSFSNMNDSGFNSSVSSLENTSDSCRLSLDDSQNYFGLPFFSEPTNQQSFQPFCEPQQNNHFSLSDMNNNYMSFSLDSFMDLNSQIQPNNTYNNFTTEQPWIKMHHCSFDGCNKKFKRREHLRRHFMSHSGTRPYLCPIANCAKPFSRKDNLAQHIKTHRY